MKKIRLFNVLYNVLAIVCIICVGFTGWLLVTKTRGYCVVSDSMNDTLVRGDMVFCRKVDFSTLKSGDIITVQGSSKSCYTHRVYGIDFMKGTVTTKGDANTAVDPVPAEKDRIVGRMIFKVPYLGWLSIWFGGGSYIKIAIVIALAATAMTVLSIVLEKKREVT